MIKFRDIHNFSEVPREFFHDNCEQGIGPRTLMWFCPSLTIEEAEEIFSRGLGWVSCTMEATRLHIMNNYESVKQNNEK